MIKEPSSLDRISMILKRLRPPIEKWLRANSLVATTPFLDPYQFSWVSHVEKHWSSIRLEFDYVASHLPIPPIHEISAVQKSISADAGWKTFFLYGHGKRVDANCELCPVTTAALSLIPGMRTAFFSVFEARKELPFHRGPYSGLLRYHLALKVPDVDRCGIEVAGITSSWAEGTSLLFDDTFEHRAWNHTDESRVVLFVDIVRPLRWPVSAANRAILGLLSLTPYVRDARKRQLEWNRSR